jgi:hypothetical protein
MALPIDNLLNRVSNTIQSMPGACELYLFGSAADPASKDAYSDLDLQVISDHYQLSRDQWPWILNQVGIIDLVYPINNHPSESAFCITFENESLYQKVDIGICDRQHLGILKNIEKKILLWQQPARTDPIPLSPGDAYMPEAGTAAHFLMGELIGSVRYVKARKRGQSLTCWRFLSTKFNALLRCYPWDNDPPLFFDSALTTWEFKTLDRVLPEEERKTLLESLTVHSPQEMDLALIHFTKKITDRIYPNYKTDRTRRAQVIRKYINFLESELFGSPSNTNPLD